MGLFGNAKYSYNTYMSTLSMRALKCESDRDVSDVLAARAFGPAAGNGYSLFRAIGRNPKEAVRNVVYNVRSLLETGGHPLFMPLFLYPLVGVGLISQSRLRDVRGWLVIGSLIPATLAYLLFLHVEVRYMLPLMFPFVVFMAAGLDRLEADGYRSIVWATYALIALVSLVYLLYFRALGG